jgi:hypothetical protein
MLPCCDGAKFFRKSPKKLMKTVVCVLAQNAERFCNEHPA